MVLKSAPEACAMAVSPRLSAPVNSSYLVRSRARCSSVRFSTPAVKPALAEVAALADYGHEALEAAFAAILERHGLKTKDLAQALRVALCGKPVSPGIFDTLMLVGREEVVARLSRWL